MTIKIGYFFELNDQELVSKLQSMRRSEPNEDEIRILDYLGAGVVCGIITMLEEDILENPPIAIGTPEILTDGEYLWPSSLIYYVKKYHLALPSSFVQHMRANAWKAPSNIDGNTVKPGDEIQLG